PPFPAAVMVVAGQLLLLGVHADHRLPGIPVLPDLLIEVAELRIPVRDLAALDGLGVALQAEALLPQQARHRVRAGPVTLPGQLARQDTQRLGRPPQRRHRIPALIGLHQRQQRRPQPQIQVSQPLAAPARLPRAPAAWAPPPACGARPSAPAPASSPRAPSAPAASRPPAARATSRTPPCPSTRASAPISSRRCRSSRCGKIAPNFAASNCPVP